MIKAEQIPDEVAEDLARLRVERMGGRWLDLHVSTRAMLFFDARNELASAINAWPKAFRDDMEEAAGVRRRVVLPLHEKDG